MTQGVRNVQYRFKSITELQNILNSIETICMKHVYLFWTLEYGA